jgi:hypothetical protein
VHAAKVATVKGFAVIHALTIAILPRAWDRFAVASPGLPICAAAFAAVKTAWIASVTLKT